jgi:exodeoxyribonuclease V gamma subunit
VILSKKGSVTLLPLSVDDARSLIDTLLRAWDAGMQRPLPLAAKTGFAWLAKGSEEARKTYEGDHFSPGEVQKNPCLKRVYPTYDELAAGEAFGQWARLLLEPLSDALHGGTKPDPGGEPKAGAKKAGAKTGARTGTNAGSKTGGNDAGEGAGA